MCDGIFQLQLNTCLLLLQIRLGMQTAKLAPFPSESRDVQFYLTLGKSALRKFDASFELEIHLRRYVLVGIQQRGLEVDGGKLSLHVAMSIAYIRGENTQGRSNGSLEMCRCFSIISTFSLHQNIARFRQPRGALLRGEKIQYLHLQRCGHKQTFHLARHSFQTLVAPKQVGTSLKL